MAIYIEAGERVEGQKCEVVTRKEEWKGPKRDPVTNKLMMLYELDRNCSVEVAESLKLTDEEKEMRKSHCVHCNVGDKITGDAISLYIDTKRKVKVEVKEGQSGRHGARFISTNKRTLGHIKHPLDSYKKLLGFSTNNDTKSLNK